MSTSSPEGRYHHGDLRRALVDAALEALAQKGPAGLGLRELARQVGVSAAAPYRHFADRNALLEAVAIDGFERFTASMQEARDAVFENEQLAAMAYAYVRFAIQQPQLFRLMFSAELDHQRNPALAKAGEAAYASLAVAAAREDPTAAAEVAVTCWAFVHGLAMLLLDGQILGSTPANSDALIRKLTERFIFGLRAARMVTP
jgi:AcrR family transcriptional regulator